MGQCSQCREHVKCAAQDAWSQATQYHLIHSVVLMGLEHTGAMVTRSGKVAGTLLTLGVAGFSGSIYLRILTQDSYPDFSSTVRQATPKGGMALMAAWIALGFVSPRSIALARTAAATSARRV